MNRVVVLDHPLVRDRLARLRDAACPPSAFRRYVGDVGRLLALEATRDLPEAEVTVHTPMTTTIGRRVDEARVCVVSILRAGNGLLDPFLDVLPDARVGFLGMYRDHVTLQPHRYYARLPRPELVDRYIVVDPMLATGGSAVAALDELKGLGAAHLRLATLVSAPEGVAAVHNRHPDVEIITAALDEGLNDVGYILPGLGDAGDRIFGTPEGE